MFQTSLTNQLHSGGVVAVLVVDDASQAVPLARALLTGGISAMELTLRTPAAMEALRAIRAEVPEMIAGIGTILNEEQVHRVRQAQAAFGVAPGLNPRIVRAAMDVGLPFAPGVVTPSDIELAIEMGCRTMKFFPAEVSGGLNYLNTIAAPFAHLGVRYIPLGGVNRDNLAAYLACPHVLAVGGTWLAPREVIDRRAWDEITALAHQAKLCVQRTRGTTSSATDGRST